jgi:hypothetical protein
MYKGISVYKIEAMESAREVTTFVKKELVFYWQRNTSKELP